MSIFDFIRERISNIDLDVLSIDGAHPTWDFADLTMLLDSLEREWKEKHPDEDDTISRQAAILQLSHNKCGNDENDIAVQHDIETIRKLPPAEPKRGKWEITNLGAVGAFDSCSECKRVVKHKAPFYNYCPNCGADMRGEKDV